MGGPIIRTMFPGLDQAFLGSCLVEPDRVVPHRIVDAEGFVRMAALYRIVPKFGSGPRSFPDQGRGRASQQSRRRG